MDAQQAHDLAAPEDGDAKAKRIEAHDNWDDVDYSPIIDYLKLKGEL